MKGKLDVRFGMPYVARLRSRVEKPEATLSKELRDKLQEIIVNVLNANQLSIKAQFVEFVNSKNFKYKSAAHKAVVLSAVGPIFETVFAKDQDTLNKLVGEEEKDSSEKSDSKDEKEPGKDADKKDLPKKDAASADADSDEFE